jgi:4-amino-4-deoxy-L-arabinose transferase-like glycosyltransferase
MGKLNPDRQPDSPETSAQSKSISIKPWGQRAAIVLIFVIGFFIRLYDLTDPPLDFHEARQLYSAVIARGMYYEMDNTAPEDKRELAIEFWRSIPLLEPQIQERLVATTYLLVGGEHLWIARIYSSFFWVSAAIAVYSLAKGISSFYGAIIAIGIYLFIPFGIFASRSFQPDPFMVSILVWATWALYRWINKQTWVFAILAGLLCGFAILVKPVAVFPLLCAGFLLVLSAFSVRQFVLNKQVWTIILLTLLPVGINYLFLSDKSVTSFVDSYVLSFKDLLIQPYFYIRWVETINGILGFGTLVASLLGVVLLKGPKEKALIIGLWIGYVLYGLAFPFHFMTHNYYHLMIIPIAALSISPLTSSIFSQISLQPRIWRAIAMVILLFAAGFQLWNARVELARVDNRAEVDGWKKVARELPKDGEIIAISQGYGLRLMYYGWIEVRTWPSRSDIQMMELSDDFSFNVEKEFDKLTQGMDYFLVTDFSEFEAQPELKDILYERFPNPTRGYAHLIFDLSQNN